jgi:hypothetical protein
MSNPTPTAARYPATDAATKARILSEARQLFGADAWGDDHTEILYLTLLVLDRLGYLSSTHGLGDSHPVVEG